MSIFFMGLVLVDDGPGRFCGRRRCAGRFAVRQRRDRRAFLDGDAALAAAMADTVQKSLIGRRIATADADSGGRYARAEAGATPLGTMRQCARYLIMHQFL
jgi:hypothetical protein